MSVLHTAPVGTQLPRDHIQGGREGVASPHTCPHVDEEVFTCWPRPSLTVQVPPHTGTVSVTERRVPGAPDTSLRTVLGGRPRSPGILICGMSGTWGPKGAFCSTSQQTSTVSLGQGAHTVRQRMQGAGKAQGARPAGRCSRAQEPSGHAAPG